VKQEKIIKVIPFELVLNHIIIQAEFNGERTFKLALDTGMPVGGVILFDTEKTAQLGLSYIGQAQVGGAGGDPVMANVAQGVNLYIVDVHLPSQQIIVMPINPDVKYSLEADGIIGYEIFSRFSVKIDFDNKQIILIEGNDYKVSKVGTVLPIRLKNNYPLIECSAETMNGKNILLELLVDLGAGHALSLDIDSHDDITLPEGALASSIGVGAVGKLTGNLGRVRNFKLGIFSLSNVVTTFSTGPLARGLDFGANGNLGTDALRRFNVIFDYKNFKLILEPNNQFNEPFEYNTAGFQAVKNGTGEFQIYYVITGSPSNECGLLKDDLIIEINDEPSNKIDSNSLDKIIRGEGEELKLKIRRGSEELIYKLKLRRFI
jgi:hypothetical protein